MNLIKFFLLLALIVWLGGIIFFSAAAPTIIHLVPDRILGGRIISQMLFHLHWLGIACALVFLVASLRYSHATIGQARAFLPSHFLVLAMLACTLVSQRVVMPAVALLRTARPTPDVQQEFMRLHAWSVGLEVATLLMGLLLVYLTARRLG